MKKTIIILFIFISMPLLMASTSYNYSYYGDVLHSSPGYNYISHFNQQSIGLRYADPQDFKVYQDKVYVLSRNETQSGDLLFVLNQDFNLIESYDKFTLSEEYEQKVLSKVNEVFQDIESLFDSIFEGVVYPGVVLPLNQIEDILEAATFTWETNNSSVISLDGTTKNDTNNNQNVELVLDITIWGQNKEITFNVEVGTQTEGIEATGTGFNFIIDENVLISKLNEVLNTGFDENTFENVRDLIAVNHNADEETLELENYIIDFEDSDEEDKIYDNIKFSLITEDTNKIHGSMFELEYKTNRASGLEVVDSGIYIADTENGRIIKLNHNFEVIDAFFGVDYETFKTIDYKPSKITVDSSERMYVVANNVYEGILELDSDGSFNRFTGVNPITLTPIEVLRRFLMTEAQRATLQKFLPTNYTNIAIDEKSFIYATAKPRETNTENMIQIINPKGVDVLKKNGYHIPMGDIMYVENRDNYVVEGPSDFSDIAIGKHGIYSVLDTKRSRIFTYDKEGNLLYINGDEGQQSDKFTRGVAIDYIDENIIILDGSGTIVVYRPTEFGETVNRAVSHHNQGRFEDAAKEWEHALTLNTNYEIAYNGIGMYNLRQKNYKEAMENFKLGHDQYYYSKAFKSYRNDLIKEHFSKFVLAVGLIVVGFGSLKIYKKHRKENN